MILIFSKVEFVLKYSTKNSADITKGNSEWDDHWKKKLFSLASAHDIEQKMFLSCKYVLTKQVKPATC